MTDPGAPSLQRYPSTAEEAVPTPGAWCSCCWGTRWWRDRRRSYGWCCARCHPPDHLTPEQIRNLRTAYRILYRSDLKLADAIVQLTELARENAEVQPLLAFIDASTRSLVR